VCVCNHLIKEYGGERERKSFGILITYKRLMQHEVMKPKEYGGA
jgi:hypothetical protein